MGKRRSRKVVTDLFAKRKRARRKSARSADKLRIKLKNGPECLKKILNGSKPTSCNYSRAGISFDPNATVKKRLRELKISLESTDPKDLHVADFEVDEETKAFERAVMKQPKCIKERLPYMSPMDRRYWRRLITKYGDDYLAMARDMELNYYQHCKSMCEKKCKNFMEHYSDYLDPPGANGRSSHPKRLKKFRFVYAESAEKA